MIDDMKKLLDEKQKGTNTSEIELLHKRLYSDMDNLNKTVDQTVSKDNVGILVSSEEARRKFLEQAVLGTKKRARSRGIRMQIKQIELLKRGLPMKTKDVEMRDEHGDI